MSEAVKKKNQKILNKNKQGGKGPLAPGANQGNGSQSGMGQGNQQDQMAAQSKYAGAKGRITGKGIQQMKADGFSDKKIAKKLQKHQDSGGKLGERASERIRGDMAKGSTIDDFDAGRVLTKRDVKYMQAQGFADDKIQSYVANNKGKVGKGAANWLSRQQAKPTGGTGDSGSDGGTNEPQPTPSNPDQQREQNIGNVSGKDNQGGIGNTNVKDTGDINQTTDITNTQTQKVNQDNDINQTIGDGSNVVNNVDNSVRSFGGDNRSMVINTGNTGAQGGGSSSLTGALDGAATAATLGGFYDVDDSPAATAKFMDLHNTLNSDAQKQWGDPSTFAGQAIANADQKAEMDANALDQRIAAREKANAAQANLMYNDMFGDPSEPTADWQRPDTPEAVEEPDWDELKDSNTDF